MQQDIPGTTIFDGSQAQKGLALNRMCFSFNRAENRAAFLKDEDAYCRKYGSAIAWRGGEKPQRAEDDRSGRQRCSRASA
jgi:protocatechuate 4,5-dioxygenase alpha chain